MKTKLPSVDNEVAKPKAKTTPIGSKSKSVPPAAVTINSQLDLAEIICRRVANGKEMSGDEIGFFQQIGWSRIKIEREVRRVASIAHLQKTAGSKKDLTAKQNELADLKETNDEKCKDLQESATDIIDEIDRLQFEVRDLERDVESRTRAQAELRTKCPQHIVRVHGELIGALKRSQLNQQKNELEGKVRSLAGLPKQWSVDDHQSIVGYLKGLPKKEWQGILNSEKNAIHKQAWQQFASGKLEKLPAMQNKLADLQKQYDAKKAAIDEQLDCYLI